MRWNKNNIMTTVTVEYDETNPLVEKVLDLLRSIGAKIKTRSSESELDLALEELRSGKTIKCDSFEDYLSKVGA